MLDAAAALRTAQPWTLGALLLWLLIGPRIELPALHGLRVEDLVFVALAAVSVRNTGAIGLPRAVTFALLAVAGTGLLSAVVASVRGMVDPVTAALFALRPLEYWIALPASMLLLKTWRDARRRTDLLLAIVTVVQTGFAVAQYYFALPVGFSHAAYTRAAGLTVGPYELGAISAALLVYWVARGRLPLASLAAIALTASISRVSLLGAGLALALLAGVWIARLLLRVRHEGVRAAMSGLRPHPWRAATGVASVCVALVVLAFTLGLITPPTAPVPVAEGGTPTAVASSAPGATGDPDVSQGAGGAEKNKGDKGGKKEKGHQGSGSGDGDGTPSDQDAPPSDEPVVTVPPDSITQRLETTSVFGSWAASARLAAAVPHVRTSVAYQALAYTRLKDFVPPELAAASGTEASNLVRFFRWHLILDTFAGPLDVIFGLGPSFVGPSVDGSYLRMYADGGLLGLAAWIALLIAWLRRGPLWMVCVTVSMLVGATFIDIVYAERPMVLFWLLLGIAVVGSGARGADRVPRQIDRLTGDEPGRAVRSGATA